jgi:membrane protein
MTDTKGWKEILLRVKDEFSDDQIPLISAGVTFYIVLAIFPGIAAVVSLYALVGDARGLADHLQALSHVMPGGAVTVIGDQMRSVLASHKGGLSLAFVLGLIIAIWSASGAVRAVIDGLNVAYEVKEKRGFIRLALMALAFTLAFTAFGLLTAAALGAAPAVMTRLGVAAVLVVEGLAWAALFVAMGVGLALLYRFGPCRGRVRFRWITWGSALAVFLWLVLSVGFTFYVANFGSYNKTYGSLGAIIGFMTWIYLSVMVVLGGAELNGEIESQAKDAPKGG